MSCSNWNGPWLASAELRHATDCSVPSYLSRDNRLDFIRYYISAYDEETEDGETIYGGYGPRIFDQRGHDQLRNVIFLLRTNPTSRRAVIQLFNSEDIERRHTEVPCTCTLQFLIRRNRLHLITNMRSNDAYLGLPHDIFCFTMLQELVSRTLDTGLGSYNRTTFAAAPICGHQRASRRAG